LCRSFLLEELRHERLRLGYVAVGDATLVSGMAKLVPVHDKRCELATQVAAGRRGDLGELLCRP